MSKAEVGALLGVSGKVVLSTHVECPQAPAGWPGLERLGSFVGSRYGGFLWTEVTQT